MPPNKAEEILRAITRLETNYENFARQFESYLRTQAERDRKQDECIVDLNKRVRVGEDDRLKSATRMATLVAIASGVSGFIGIGGTILAKSFHLF
jgi:hypothetical protein